MPSARELLEQADALMRRNRSPLMDDIPVLTDSVPEVVRRRESPRPSMADVPADTEDAQAEASRAPDTIPVLTETVATEDDEPEINLAPPLPPTPVAMVDEGDASTWLRTGGAEPSVIGDAPDSIARVPAYVDEGPEEIDVEAPLEVEESFDEELALLNEPADASPAATSGTTDGTTSDTVQETVHATAHEAPATSPDAGAFVDEPPAPEVLAWEDDAPADAQAALTAPAIALAAAPPTHAASPAPPAVDEAAQEAEEEARRAAEEEARRAAEEEARKAAEEEARKAAEEEAREAAEEEARKAAEEEARKAAEEEARRAAEVARKAAEEVRWASMAEEIRMQVLQRIDLFTDTGLRDQLGARLQPIVDRASADLVATINQHVGDLLRTYVAEAIEREIENWKSNTRGL